MDTFHISQRLLFSSSQSHEWLPHICILRTCEFPEGKAHERTSPIPTQDCGPPWLLTYMNPCSALSPSKLPFEHFYQCISPVVLLQVNRPSLCLSRFRVDSLPCNFNSLMNPRNVIDFPRKSSASCCCKGRMISKLVMYPR